MLKFFYLFAGIYTSTNNESISTAESVVCSINSFYDAKGIYQCNQNLNGNNNTKQFLEQENFELKKISGNALNLEEVIQSKVTSISVPNSPIFDTRNVQCFKKKHNETFENPVRKKLKLGDNSKCITNKNEKHRKIFQNSPIISDSITSSLLTSPKQYDEVLNFDKAINDRNKNQNDNIECIEVIRYSDKEELLNSIYNVYAKRFHEYLIDRKNLNWNSVLQNGKVQSINQQSTNLDLFMDFCKEVLMKLKSAFYETKNEQVSTSEEIFLFRKKNKKFITELTKLKKIFYDRKRTFKKSVERQIKNIEESSFFKESSSESTKKLIVECNIFIKEMAKYLLSFNLTVNLGKKDIKYIYNECKDIFQRLRNISQTFKPECIVVIIKMLIERLEGTQGSLISISRSISILFDSVTHLSSDVDWLISPLKDIMNGIDKEYERKELI